MKAQDQFVRIIEALEHISARTSPQRSLQKILQEVLPILEHAFGAQYSAVWLVAKTTPPRLLLVASHNLKKEFVRYFQDRKHWPRMGEGLVGQASLAKQRRMTLDILHREDVPAAWKKLITESGVEFQTLISQPLLAGTAKKAVGVLNLYYRRKTIMPEYEMRLLRIVANDFGAALESHALYSSLQDHRKEIEVQRDQLAGLQRATAFLSISEGKSLYQILDELSQSVGRAVKTSMLAIWRPTEDKKHLYIFVHKGMVKEYVRAFNKNPLSISRKSVVGTVAVTGKPYYLFNARSFLTEEIDKQRVEIALRDKAVSICSLPLFVKGSFWGVLNFYFAEAHSYSLEERSILESIGNMMAVAIGNSEYRQELQDAHKALMGTLEETQAIIANFTDAIFVFNEDNRVELVNREAEKLFRIAKEEIVGKDPAALRLHESVKSVVELVGEGLQEVFRQEGKISPDITVEVTSMKARGEAGFRGTLLVCHDVTREKRVDEMKSEFVSLAAHQLRTPLSALKWTLRMLLEGDAGPVSGEQTQFLDKAYRSNERMIGLVSELLEVSKVEEGKYLYRPKPARIEEIVEGVLQTYADEVKEKHMEIFFRRPESALPVVVVDQEKIELAVENLIDNAFRYTPAGGKIIISFALRRSYVEVAIADTGIGITQLQQQRVFERFFRADNAKKIDTEGSGLGLYLVKNIIEAHGGKIWFVSKEREGTTFTFSLPLNKKNH